MKEKLRAGVSIGRQFKKQIAILLAFALVASLLPVYLAMGDDSGTLTFANNITVTTGTSATATQSSPLSSGVSVTTHTAAAPVIVTASVPEQAGVTFNWTVTVNGAPVAGLVGQGTRSVNFPMPAGAVNIAVTVVPTDPNAGVAVSAGPNITMTDNDSGLPVTTPTVAAGTVVRFTHNEIVQDTHERVWTVNGVDRTTTYAVNFILETVNTPVNVTVTTAEIGGGNGGDNGTDNNGGGTVQPPGTEVTVALTGHLRAYRLENGIEVPVTTTAASGQAVFFEHTLDQADWPAGHMHRVWTITSGLEPGVTPADSALRTLERTVRGNVVISVDTSPDEPVPGHAVTFNSGQVSASWMDGTTLTTLTSGGRVPDNTAVTFTLIVAATVGSVNQWRLGGPGGAIQPNQTGATFVHTVTGDVNVYGEVVPVLRTVTFGNNITAELVNPGANTPLTSPATVPHGREVVFTADDTLQTGNMRVWTFSTAPTEVTGQESVSRNITANLDVTLGQRAVNLTGARVEVRRSGPLFLEEAIFNVAPGETIDLVAYLVLADGSRMYPPQSEFTWSFYHGHIAADSLYFGNDGARFRFANTPSGTAAGFRQIWFVVRHDSGAEGVPNFMVRDNMPLANVTQDGTLVANTNNTHSRFVVTSTNLPAGARNAALVLPNRNNAGYPNLRVQGWNENTPSIYMTNLTIAANGTASFTIVGTGLTTGVYPAVLHLFLPPNHPSGQQAIVIQFDITVSATAPTPPPAGGGGQTTIPPLPPGTFIPDNTGGGGGASTWTPGGGAAAAPTEAGDATETADDDDEPSADGPTSIMVGSVNIPTEIDEDGTVTVDLDEETINTLVEEAEDNVVFDLSAHLEAVALLISNLALAAFAEAELGLTVALPHVSINVTFSVLFTIVAYGADDTNFNVVPATNADLNDAQQDALHPGANLLDISIVTGDEYVSDLGGEMSTTVGYYGAGDPGAWRVNPNGTLDELPADYNPATGEFTFYKEDLSIFMVAMVPGSLEVAPPPPPLPPAGPVHVMRLTIGSTTYTHLGVARTGDVAPFIDEATARTMIPLRIVAEALGAELEWVPDRRGIYIYHGATTLSLTIDEEIGNDAAGNPFGSPMLVNDSTYVPARYVIEALGARVEWDDAARAVDIFN